jgi:hypothetical protein
MKRLILFVCFLFLAFPVSAQQSQPASPAPTPGTNASEKPAPDNTLPFACLHIYRQRRYEGSALAPSIYVDDKPVARVGNGRRFTARISPGPHAIRSDDKSSAIALDVKPGQDYYIRVDEQTGFWKGHGKLTMLMPEQGKAEYQLQKPIEPDRRIAKDMLVDEDSVSTPTSEPKSGK